MTADARPATKMTAPAAPLTAAARNFALRSGITAGQARHGGGTPGGANGPRAEVAAQHHVGTSSDTSRAKSPLRPAAKKGVDRPRAGRRCRRRERDLPRGCAAARGWPACGRPRVTGRPSVRSGRNGTANTSCSTKRQAPAPAATCPAPPARQPPPRRRAIAWCSGSNSPSRPRSGPGAARPALGPMGPAGAQRVQADPRHHGGKPGVEMPIPSAPLGSPFGSAAATLPEPRPGRHRCEPSIR